MIDKSIMDEYVYPDSQKQWHHYARAIVFHFVQNIFVSEVKFQFGDLVVQTRRHLVAALAKTKIKLFAFTHSDLSFLLFNWGMFRSW